MTVQELAQVMGDSFIAVGVEGKQSVSYSGRASKLNTYLAREEVGKVIPPRDKYSATIIYVKRGEA